MYFRGAFLDAYPEIKVAVFIAAVIVMSAAAARTFRTADQKKQVQTCTK